MILRTPEGYPLQIKGKWGHSGIQDPVQKILLGPSVSFACKALEEQKMNAHPQRFLHFPADSMRFPEGFELSGAETWFGRLEHC